MAASSDVHLIHLLVGLYREGDQWFRRLPATDWRRKDSGRILAECRLQRFSHPDDVQRTLIGHLEGRLARPRKAIFLEPWDKAANFMLLLEPVFGETANGALPKTTFNLGAVTYSDSKHRLFGYRYESPEGGQTHNFYHAQPIVGFDGLPTKYSIKWYPDKWPAHALYVRDNCQLLLALMLSFQGFPKVQSQATRAQSVVRKYAAALLAQLAPAA